MKPSGSTSGWPKMTETSIASSPMPTAMEIISTWARRYTAVSLGAGRPSANRRR